MKLNKEQKKKKSVELSKELKSAESVFFTSFQGLKFIDISELRQKLASLNCRFSVIKNSVTIHALKAADLGQLPDKSVLKGPTAIALVEKGDFIAVAKVLGGFGKEFSAVKMKACYSENKWFDELQCKALSALSTRKETFGQLAGKLYFCISKIAGVMHAPMRDLAFVLKALEDKKKNVIPAPAKGMQG
jgi:large subunit ribosomal protein L10